MKHKPTMSTKIAVLSCLLLLLLAPCAQAQTDRLTVRKGVSFEFPVNANVTDNIRYDKELQHIQYGIFSVAVVELDDFYRRDQATSKKLEELSHAYTRRLSMPENQTFIHRILKEHTVLDDLNPVYGVEEKFENVGKYYTLRINFKKRTEAGLDFTGACVGYYISEKKLLVKTIHYYPTKDAPEDAQAVSKAFFESIKVAR